VLAFDPRTDYGLLLKATAAAGFLVLLILLWNRQLRRRRAQLQLAESEARSANSALLRMHAELEDRVRNRTEALMETERALHQAQKMEALGTLVGGIAHDFNNILTGILGSVKLMQLGVSDAAKREELLQRSSALGHRGADMIQQLLSFARQDDSSKEDILMANFLDESAALIRTALPSSIELIVSKPDDEEFVVLGSATRLQQVLLNLSNNARDAVADCSTRRRQSPEESRSGGVARRISSWNATVATPPQGLIEQLSVDTKPTIPELARISCQRTVASR
jgi:C4-dicarboxylate-specific signal transduction histidine kinase